MKFLLDFFPIILFFISYKYAGLNIAIIAMTLATIMQILYTRWQTKKFEKMQVITLGLLIVFGGLTIIINNPAFIMWKVSVFYIIFSVIILASLFTKKTMIEKLMGANITAPTKVWREISHLWGWGFLIIAAINAYFVDLALTSRGEFLAATSDKYNELSIINCNTTPAPELCLTAQNFESMWVDFKLFGTLILTLILIFITIAMLKNYIKDNEKNSSL